jgi:hypothetical protein
MGSALFDEDEQTMGFPRCVWPINDVMFVFEDKQTVWEFDRLIDLISRHVCSSTTTLGSSLPPTRTHRRHKPTHFARE